MYINSRVCTPTNQIFSEQTVCFATLALEVLACADKGAHLAASAQDCFQGPEPESIGVPCFVIVLAQRLQPVNHSLIVGAVIPVDQKHKYVKQ